MEVKTIREKGDAELRRELDEQREALRRARFELSGGKEKNIGAVQKTRKTIARILTVLAQREHSA